MFTPNADELVANNASFAEGFDGTDLPAAPARHLAVIACMDCRLDVPAMLGLDVGEAHIIRNAGGVVTDDVVRSLTLSQRSLGTREIVLIHHTDCGLHNADEEAFARELEGELGVTPPWALEAFADPYADVRDSAQRLRMTPFVPHTDHIRGFVYDVADGRLDEVDLDG